MVRKQTPDFPSVLRSGTHRIAELVVGRDVSDPSSQYAHLWKVIALAQTAAKTPGCLVVRAVSMRGS
jgi:hypothetical protein